MRMKFLVSLTFGFLLLGCSEGGQDFGALKESFDENVEIATTNKVVATGLKDPVAEAKDRRVIFDAEVDLVVSDFAELSRQVAGLVREHHGYIAKVNINQKVSYSRGTWELKIRSDLFDAFLLKLNEIGEIEYHQQVAQDVTKEFVDLEARMVNKKRLEQRVLELINNQRGLKEVIGLEHELARVREEVERMQGRLNYLKNKTNFATITLKVRESRPVVAESTPTFSDRWKSAWAETSELLMATLQSIVIFLTFVIPWIVVGLAILLPVYYVLARLHRRLTLPLSDVN